MVTTGGVHKNEKAIVVDSGVGVEPSLRSRAWSVPARSGHTDIVVSKNFL